MKRSALMVFGLFLAFDASAQGGPAVKGNTGDLTYVYPIDLPAARGKVQPSIALLYNSKSKVDRGYGLGWDLSPFYVEHDQQNPLNPVSVLVRGDRRDRYTGDSSGGIVFESNQEGLLVAGEQGGTSVTHGDGRRMRFYARLGDRYYLSKITDPEGNAAAFEYDGDHYGGGRLVRVFYNMFQPADNPYPNVIGNQANYANVVEFSYADISNGHVENVAGALVTQNKRLMAVTVKGKTSAEATTWATLRRYDIEYTGDAAQSIWRITERGLGTSAKPPTVFTYDQALDLGLGDEQSVAGFPSTDTFELVDLDGDGLADLRMGTQWSRSMGSPGLTPWFGSVQDILRSNSGATLPGASSGEITDFDGDGAVDFVRRGAPECTASGSLLVRFGRSHSTLGLTFDEYTCVDASPVYMADQPVCVAYSSDPSCLVFRRDVNGDRILDHILRVSATEWTVFITVHTQSGWYTAKRGSVSAFAVDQLQGPLFFQDVDINGDGMLDAVACNPIPPNYPFYASQPTAQYPANPVAVNLWTTITSDLGMYQTTTLPFPPSNWGWQYPALDVVGGGSCQTRVWDPRVAKWWALDVNGDDIPDWLRQTSSTTVGVTTTAPGTIASERALAVNGNGAVIPRGRYLPSYQFVGASFSPPELGLLCAGTTTLSATPFAQFMDLDGDGIPDHLAKAVSQPAKFRKGSFTKADTSGAPENSLAVAKPLLLKSVTQPNGTKTGFTYRTSRGFGDHTATRPVVTAIEVTGPRLPAGIRTEYRYEYNSTVSQLRRAWQGPLLSPAGYVENVGFGRTLVLDVAKNWVTATVWRVDDSAYAGLASSVKIGPNNGSGLFDVDPIRIVSSVATEWTRCGTSASVIASRTVTEQYYDSVFGRASAGTEVVVPCSDVKCRASATKSISREFISVQGIPWYGPSVTTERKFYREGTNGTRAEPAEPWCEESPCAGLGNYVTTEVTSETTGE